LGLWVGGGRGEGGEGREERGEGRGERKILDDEMLLMDAHRANFFSKIYIFSRNSQKKGV
jgi:hypothetical protein